MNLIEKIKAAFELYFAIKPQVQALVNEAELLFVGAGRGAEKLAYVRECLASVLSATDTVVEVANSAWPFLLQLVAIVWAASNISSKLKELATAVQKLEINSVQRAEFEALKALENERNTHRDARFEELGRRIANLEASNA
jgi:hypothetical protein